MDAIPMPLPSLHAALPSPRREDSRRETIDHILVHHLETHGRTRCSVPYRTEILTVTCAGGTPRNFLRPFWMTGAASTLREPRTCDESNPAGIKKKFKKRRGGRGRGAPSGRRKAGTRPERARVYALLQSRGRRPCDAARACARAALAPRVVRHMSINRHACALNESRG